MSDEILNLSTIVKRKTINIESKKHPTGKLYEVVNQADLGPYEYAIVLQRNEQVGPLLDKMRGGTRLSPAEQRKLKKALADTVSMIVVDLEPQVLAELTIQQQELIVIAWSAHIQAQMQETTPGNRQSRSTTAASRPGSKRSTAATRRGGSTSRTGS